MFVKKDLHKIEGDDKISASGFIVIADKRSHPFRKE